MLVQDRLYTADDLWDMSHRAGETRRLELVRGTVREMAPTGGLHGVVTLEFGYHILHYVKQHKLGYVTGAETGFVLAADPYIVRAPDVAFIAGERITLPLPEKFFSLAPDLVVEVISPSDTAQDIRERVLDYLKAGTRLVWVVYPDAKTVDIYRSADARIVDIAAIDDMLSGDDVLPGFQLPLRDVFASIGG